MPIPTIRAASTRAHSIPHALTSAADVARHFGFAPGTLVSCDADDDLDQVEALRDQLLALSRRAASIDASVRAERRAWTADEQDQVAALHREFEVTEARLAAAETRMAEGERPNETLAQRDRRLRASQSAGRPTQRAQASDGRTSTPAVRGRDRAAEPATNARLGVVLDRSLSSPSGSIFGPGSGYGDWRDGDEFLASIANRVADPRLIAAATMTEGVGADGGHLVPEQLYRGIVDGLLQRAEFAGRCRVFPSLANNLLVPLLDTSDRRVSIAGVAAQWVGEASQGTAQKLRFRTVEMRLGKIMILAEASSELLEDATGFEAQLMEALNGSTSYTVDDAIIGGTGVGQPLGILNSPSAISIAPESGQVADTVLYENIVNMWSRMHPRCQRGATWFISPGVMAALLQMRFPGSTTPVLLGGGFSGAAAAAAPMTIFGQPVVVHESMPTLGDAGDIICVDLAQYGLLLKSSARIAMDGGPGFDRDVATWRLTLRINGTPLWPTVVTPRDGGPTLTWATYLAARS